MKGSEMLFRNSTLTIKYTYEQDPTNDEVYIRGGPNKCLDVQNLMTSQQTFLHQHRVPCCHSYDTNTILFLLAKLALDGKMFGKSGGFPDSAETGSRKDFRVIMYYD